MAHVALLPDDHVVVAVVTEDYDFDGVHHVARTELVERVPALEGENGWAMVFSEGTDAAHVEARTTEMIVAGLQADRDDQPDRRPPPGLTEPGGVAASRLGAVAAQSGSGPCGGSMPCWRSRRSRSSSP